MDHSISNHIHLMDHNNLYIYNKNLHSQKAHKSHARNLAVSRVEVYSLLKALSKNILQNQETLDLGEISRANSHRL